MAQIDSLGKKENSVLEKALSLDKVQPNVPSPIEYFKLPSKQQLAYTEYGCKSGYPLIYFHDNGSSRLECSFYHHSACKQGYRLIAVDRPGIGGSTFYPLQSCTQFCQDILLLADELDLSEFGVLSLGAGGVYGLTLAHMAPDRVSIQLCLGGVPGTVFNEPDKHSTLSNCVNSIAPSVIKFLVRLKHTLFSENVELALRRQQEYLGYTDRKILSNPQVFKMLALDQSEVVRQGGRGVAQDAALCFHKLNFSLHDVAVPAQVWQGAADRLSKRSDCEYLVSNLPFANFYRVANAGHFFFLQHMDEVLARLQIKTSASVSKAA